MTDWEYAGLFAVKLALELAGCWSDNWYLIGRAVRAAILSGVVAAGSIYIGRKVIADRDDTAAAVVIAAFIIARYFGCLSLAKHNDRKEREL
jgi:hypothetical protein